MAGVDDDWNQSDAFGEDDRWDLQFDEELDETIDELLRSEFDRVYPSSSGDSYYALDELRPTLVRVRRRQQFRRAAGATMAGAALSVLGVMALGQIEPPGGARVEVLSPAANEKTAGPVAEEGAFSSVRPGLPASSGAPTSEPAVASEPSATEAQTGASSADAPRSADGTDESTTSSTVTPSSATSVVAEVPSSVATTAAPTTGSTTTPTTMPVTTATTTGSGPTTSSTVYSSIPKELEIRTSCGGKVKLKANRYRVYVDEIEDFRGSSEITTYSPKRLEVSLDSGGDSCKVIAEVKSGELWISIEDDR